MKVVCINNKPIGKDNPHNDSLHRLKEGEVYTVLKEVLEGYELVEVKSTHPLKGFNGTRFRKVDFGFGEKLLSKIEEEINEEQLICI
jgi:hypothetical protein